MAVTDKLYATGRQDEFSVECYSTEQNSWSFVPPLLTSLLEFFAFECQGKIYMVGGYTKKLGEHEQLGHPGEV